MKAERVAAERMAEAAEWGRKGDRELRDECLREAAYLYRTVGMDDEANAAHRARRV